MHPIHVSLTTSGKVLWSSEVLTLRRCTEAALLWEAAAAPKNSPCLPSRVLLRPRVLQWLSVPAHCFCITSVTFDRLMRKTENRWVVAGEEKVDTERQRDGGGGHIQSKTWGEKREGEEAAAQSKMKEDTIWGMRGGLWSFKKRQLLRKWGGWRKSFREKGALGTGRRWSC